MQQPKTRTLQRLALFLALPLSLLATVPFSQYTVHALRNAALQQQEIWLAQHEQPAGHSALTHQLVEILVVPFAARKQQD